MLFNSKHLSVGSNTVYTTGSNYEVVNINICNTLQNSNTFNIAINIDDVNSIPTSNYICYTKSIDPVSTSLFKALVLKPNTNIVISVVNIGLDVSIFGAADA